MKKKPQAASEVSGPASLPGEPDLEKALAAVAGPAASGEAAGWDRLTEEPNQTTSLTAAEVPATSVEEDGAGLPSEAPDQAIPVTAPERPVGSREGIGSDSLTGEPTEATPPTAAQGPAEAEEERSYFRSLEDHLAALRQGWLLLTPADWLVARNWRRQGVPLDLVRRTMEELYARRIERGSKRRINSLRYFARAVEAAWEEVRSLTAPGRRQTVPPLDVSARLAALAAALPADLHERESLAALILSLSGNTERVEAALAALDAEILHAAETALEDAARKDLTASEAKTLARLAGRLPEAEVAAARRRLRAQLLRRRLRLPVLSLFSPEAQPPELDEGQTSALQG